MTVDPYVLMLIFELVRTLDPYYNNPKTEFKNIDPFESYAAYGRIDGKNGMKFT